MFELYKFSGMDDELIKTFNTREDMVQYMEENELYTEYEDGYIGLCPDGEEITL